MLPSLRIVPAHLFPTILMPMPIREQSLAPGRTSQTNIEPNSSEVLRPSMWIATPKTSTKVPQNHYRDQLAAMVTTTSTNRSCAILRWAPTGIFSFPAHWCQTRRLSTAIRNTSIWIRIFATESPVSAMVRRSCASKTRMSCRRLVVGLDRPFRYINNNNQ